MSAETTPSQHQDEFKTPLRVVKRQHPTENTPSATLSTKKLKTMAIPPSPFLTKLGYGTGVNVYLMERPQTPSGKLKSPWAIKKLNSRCKVAAMNKTFEDRLKYESDVLKAIKHENIIGYRETLRSADGSICLCLEKGDKSLADILETRKDDEEGPLNPENLHKVALAVIRGLHYLHNDQKLLHGDIKSQNVLVKGDNFNQVKLCDFGVCLKLKDDLSGLANPEDEYEGTLAWSSNDELVTDKADIYSYGCLLFEMLTLNIPHMPPLDLDDNSALEESFDQEAFYDAVGTVPVLPEMDYTEDYFPYIALMKACCNEVSEERPSAEEVLKVLTGLNSTD